MTSPDDPEFEPIRPAYDTWTPCEPRTPEQIRAEEGEVTDDDALPDGP